MFPASKNAARAEAPAATLPWVCFKLLQHNLCANVCSNLRAYCNSLVTSCCTVLACASAAMPVWLRISYFDMFDVADA